MGRDGKALPGLHVTRFGPPHRHVELRHPLLGKFLASERARQSEHNVENQTTIDDIQTRAVCHNRAIIIVIIINVP